MVEYNSKVIFFYEKELSMNNKVFDTLGWCRKLRAPYAASRTEPHLVTAPEMGCATTARLEAIALEPCQGEGVSRDEIPACESLDALTAPSGPRVPLAANAWPVSAALCWAAACARMLCCGAGAGGVP
jgi:hypothetical protein